MMDLVVIGLLANKADKSDNMEVTEEEGRKFADENGLYFGIASAKTGEGVKDFFDSIIKFTITDKFP